jgi:hypothetical protein
MRHAIEEAAKMSERCPEMEHLLSFVSQSKRGVCRASSVQQS